jgi:hypothetical protein
MEMGAGKGERKKCRTKGIKEDKSEDEGLLGNVFSPLVLEEAG